jgi:hypothetical protein
MLAQAGIHEAVIEGPALPAMGYSPGEPKPKITGQTASHLPCQFNFRASRVFPWLKLFWLNCFDA